MLTRTLIVSACFAIGGCSTLTEYGALRTEKVMNEQGHVIGQKQLLRNQTTGEVIARVSLYSPLLNDKGELVGYEESARGGSIIRDLDGYAIGSRFTDLRSRATNAHGKGLMIVFRPRDSQSIAAAQPDTARIVQLMASLSASDLRRIQ